MFRRRKKNSNWQNRNPRLYATRPEKEKKAKRRIFVRFLFWLLLLIFSGVVFYLVFFSGQLDLENITVRGNENITSTEIAAAAQKSIEGKYWKYFPRSNFFLFKQKETAEALKNSFLRLEVNSIEKKFPTELLISVKERQPEIIWCSGGACYFADREGFVYGGVNLEDEQQNQAKYLKIVDENAKPVEIGKTQIERNFVEYLKAIDAMILDDLKFVLADSYHTPALSSGEVFVKISQQDSEGWTLKLDSSTPPEDAKKIIQTVFEKDIQESRMKDLDYLDLTVKGKVYYKFR